MDTARVDIRKLQLLNDRLNQSLEALNQVRLTVHGLQPGLGGQVPFQGSGIQAQAPFPFQSPPFAGAPTPQGFTHTNPAPLGFQQQSPFGQVPFGPGQMGQYPFAQSPFGQQQSPFGQHSPFAQPSLFGQQSPFAQQSFSSPFWQMGQIPFGQMPFSPSPYGQIPFSGVPFGAFNPGQAGGLSHASPELYAYGTQSVINDPLLFTRVTQSFPFALHPVPAFI